MNISAAPAICPRCEGGTRGLPAGARYCPRCGTRFDDPTLQLNPEQLRAVLTTNGPLAVIAGAGSGKTRVIEFRVLQLVEQGVDPESILLLTFTRKAAREMLSRAADRDSRCRNVSGGTFHWFAHRMLREHAAAIGLDRDFTILDAIDASRALVRSLRNFHPRTEAFPEAKDLQRIFSLAAARQLPFQTVLASDFPGCAGAHRDVVAAHGLYSQFKASARCVDFDDLLLGLAELLLKPEIADQLQRRVRYVMVDEFQDTNALEGKITNMLACEPQNLMVVGDDAQSIFGFRGAHWRNILDFPAQFAGCPVVKLERNYRSTQAILDVANAALAGMRETYSKCLTAASGERGERSRLVSFRNDRDEAAWLISELATLRRQGVPFAQQCVLYRSSFMSNELQLALQQQAIPFRICGGRRWVELEHVKDALAYLRVLVSCHDAIAWMRLLDLTIPDAEESEGLAQQLGSAGSLPRCLGMLTARGGAAAAVSVALSRLDPTRQSVRGVVRSVVDSYAAILRRKRYDSEERMQDLETLVKLADRSSSVVELLAELSLDSHADASERTDGPQPKDQLTLSTIHSAKGLEWDAVFVIGLKDGVFPDRRMRQQRETAEEEHRMFYVAVTRAKRTLVLCTRQGAESQFVADPIVRRTLRNVSPEVQVNQPPATEPRKAPTHAQTWLRRAWSWLTG